MPSRDGGRQLVNPREHNKHVKPLQTTGFRYRFRFRYIICMP